MAQHTQRFANKVESYIKSRPGYPGALLDVLKRECGLASNWTVADIGSGTGLLSELFLKNGNKVLGVEPNTEMREASEKLLAGYQAFQAIAGSAEDTKLPKASARLITAAQAFHWFDQAKARAEFQRILQPGGAVAIVFNTRKVEGNPFGQAYEELVKKYDTGANYGDLRHENITHADFKNFFGPKGCKHMDVPYVQRFDIDGVKGRVASMSWVPVAGDPRFEPMMADVEQLFARFQRSGNVNFEYITEMHYGQLS